MGMFSEWSHMAQRPREISLTQVEPFSISDIHTDLYQFRTGCTGLGCVGLG
jgi:hypothetical protein